MKTRMREFKTRTWLEHTGTMLIWRRGAEQGNQYMGIPDAEEAEAAARREGYLPAGAEVEEAVKCHTRRVNRPYASCTYWEPPTAMRFAEPPQMAE